MTENKKARILIIDDDSNILEVFETALKDAGYEVVQAKNGKEALELSNTNHYHLALIDIRLPDVEGTKMLEAFSKSNPKMKKIIITGFPSASNAIEALNKQADAYLVKPVNIDDLLSEVAKQLKVREEDIKYSEQKVAEFVNSRIKEIQTLAA
ncbi:MAG TPA: response regulator [Candidatus Bathyarchaeia archaeon]|nr:response regulator [Candidatus Bathyarchaeia archaeon]